MKKLAMQIAKEEGLQEERIAKPKSHTLHSTMTGRSLCTGREKVK
jgi:hypothetical protein